MRDGFATLDPRALTRRRVLFESPATFSGAHLDPRDFWVLQTAGESDGGSAGVCRPSRVTSGSLASASLRLASKPRSLGLTGSAEARRR